TLNVKTSTFCPGAEPISASSPSAYLLSVKGTPLCKYAAVQVRQLALGVLAQRRALDRQLAHDAGALARRIAVVPPEANALPRRQQRHDGKDSEADLDARSDFHVGHLSTRNAHARAHCHLGTGTAH